MNGKHTTNSCRGPSSAFNSHNYVSIFKNNSLKSSQFSKHFNIKCHLILLYYTTLQFCMFQTFPFTFASFEFICCYTLVLPVSFAILLLLTQLHTAKCSVRAEKSVSVQFFRSLPSSWLPSCPVISAC